MTSVKTLYSNIFENVQDGMQNSFTYILCESPLFDTGTDFSA